MPGQQSNHLPYPQSSTATAVHTEKQYQQPFQTSKIWYEVGCLKPRKPSRKNLKKTGQALQQILPWRNGAFWYQTAAFIVKSKTTNQRNYLFVGIGDYSSELYLTILLDCMVAGRRKFLLRDVIDCCLYTIRYAYSDNGMEYRGNASHLFAVTCVRNNINQFYPHYPTVDQR